MQSNRVFILSLDGATWRVLRPMMADGLLPTLSALVEGGVSGEHQSVVPPVSAPAWTSFQTGVNPGGHGVDDFSLVNPDGQSLRLLNASQIPVPTIWQIASDAGRCVVTLNVPITYPPRPINGATIGGMLSPDTKTFSYPKGLYEEMLAEIGDYKIVTTQHEYRQLGFARFMRELERTALQRTRAARYLMDRYAWDLFMVHYHVTDTLQHALWCYLDAEHPRYDAKRAETVRSYFQALDAQVGEVLDHAGSDSVRLVLSDHGFGPTPENIVYLNKWLGDRGYLQYRRDNWSAHIVNRLIHLAGRLDYFQWRKRLLSGEFRAGVAETARTTGIIDWTRTKAACLNGSSIYGHLRINRDTLDEPYDDFRGRLIAELGELRHPKTGERIVRKIHRREELFHGPYLDRLPDLLVRAFDPFFFDPGVPGLAGSVLIPASRVRMETGDHQPEGIAVMAGPMLKTGHTLESLDFLDLPATVLYLLGVPVPTHFDGRVLLDAVQPDYAAGNPPAAAAVDSASVAPTADYSPEDEAVIQKRLEDLGYL